MSKIKVISIGRQYCSGGSDIGRLVAEKLDIKCYDREIIEMAALRSGISMAEIKKYEESILNPLKSPISLFGKEKDDITEKIFAAETEVVMELADEGSCVIVGRCADFILKNKVRTLNVFIYASDEKRLETAISPKHNIPEDEAADMLRKYDKKRSGYYNANTTKKWGSKSSYDICLDSGRLGYELCAELIAYTYRQSR